MVFCLHRFRKMFKMFSTTLLKLKAGVFKSSGLKSVHEKLRFRDGLVLTVGLIVKIKLRCEISWNVVWRRHKAVLSYLFILMLTVVLTMCGRHTSLYICVFFKQVEQAVLEHDRK